MSIIDRYVLRIFVRVLLISFLSMAGLFIVIDAFGNVEEFVTYGKAQGGLLRVLFDYYSPRMLSFFDLTAGILSLMAAMFTITALQRANELTAIMAAGISHARVVKPLIIAVAAVSALGVANRELLLPHCRHKLSRNAQNWLGENGVRLQPRHDNETEIFFNGAQAYLDEQRIDQPNFQLPYTMGAFGRTLAADRAVYMPSSGARPGGYLLDGVKTPENLKELPSIELAGKQVVLSPRDTPWLEDGQCFIVSSLAFEQLVAGSAWRQYASSWELLKSLHNPSHDYRADVRVTIHARFVQPAMDLTLLFLGLPLVLARHNRNVFVVAGICLLLVGAFTIVGMGCHALGGSYLINPALSAWCPLLVFAPIAYAAGRSIWQ